MERAAGNCCPLGDDSTEVKPSRGPAPSLVVLAVVSALVVLAGCSSGSTAPPSATSAVADASLGVVTTDPDGVQEVTLQTGDDYVFTPAAFTVAPGTVRLTVRNVAQQMTHQFEFTAGTGPAALSATIPFLGPGQTQTVEFDVTTPGDYPFDCTFHLALGQTGVMTVEG